VRVYQFRHQGTGSRGKGILTENYFVAGAAGAGNAGAVPPAGAGAGTAAFAGAADFALARTEDLGRACINEITTASTENATKDHVVILSRSVVAPRAPKVVCEEEAPKAADTSAPFPCWRSTTRIRKTQTMT
jgi:hypothetical protein